MRKIIATTILALLIALCIVQTAGAQAIDPDLRPINEPFNVTGAEDDGTPAGSGTAIAILQIIAGGLLYFAAPVGVIMIASAAFQMVTGGADSEQIEQAKKNLTWAVIGLVLIILSYSLVRFVINFAQQAGDQERLGTATENSQDADPRPADPNDTK